MVVEPKVNIKVPSGMTLLARRCQPEKRKFASISLTVQDRAISSKFLAHRVYKQDTLLNSHKFFPLSKNGGHFEFLTKMLKLKIACIS